MSGGTDELARGSRLIHRTAFNDVSKLLSGSMLAKLFGIASTIVFTRILTKEEMSVFPVFLMLAGIPNLVLTFGIFSTFIREIPHLFRHDESVFRRLVVTGSAVIMFGIVVTSVAAVFWSHEISEFAFKDGTQDWVIKLFVPGFIAFGISKIAEAIMIGRAQFGETSLIQILESVIRPSMTIALYFIFGFSGIVVGLIAAQVVVAMIGFYYVRDVFLQPIPHIYPLRTLAAQSMPYYIGNYLSFLRGDGDSLLITTVLGPSALAEYYVAKNLYSNILLVYTAVDRVAVERLARFVRTPEFLEKISDLHLRIAEIMVPFTLLAITLSPYAISVLAGPRYREAIWPAIVLLLAALAQFVAIPVERTVFVAFPGLTRVYYALAEVAAVLCAVALLVPIAGLIGVAAGRFISPLGGYALGLWLLRRKFELRLSFRPVLLSLATALPGTIIVLLFAPFARNILEATGGAATGVAVWVLLFAALTYVLNRPLFRKVRSMVFRRFQTVVAR